MLKQTIDFQRPLVCLEYLRMSDPKQNPRSPDQQSDEIKREMRRCGYPWRVVRQFRDDGIKGAFVRRRPKFFEMITLIRSRELTPDAVLVDTFERFGRANEVGAIRDELWNAHGVLVLTADSHFADPTTQAGKALQFVENLRATTGNEVKAHDVWRGKLDRAREKRWPGGPPPFGKRLLRNVLTDHKGREVVDTRLVSDPETEWIVLRLLRLALDTKEGSPTLARTLNDDPEVPARFKPFRADRVAYILDNPIYAGVYRWARKCTGVRNDVRVQQRNPDGPELVHDFCPPLIGFAEWQQIQQTRRERGEFLRTRRAAAPLAAAGVDGASKQIAALAPGLTLKYLLSGLIVCGECNSRMTACSSTGESRNATRYAYYRCPLYAASGGRGCRNGRYVREDQLRAGVLGRVRALLFPPPVADGKVLDVPDWLVELDGLVRQNIATLASAAPDRRESVRHEIADLEEQVRGLDASIRKTDLPHRLRERYEAQSNEALEMIDRLRQELVDLDGRQQQLDRVLDVRTVLERLRRLEDVLAGGNVTDGNAELSLHVQGVYCFAGGRVEMRTCKLGAFAGALELLSPGGGASVPPLPAAAGDDPGAGSGGATGDGACGEDAGGACPQHRVKPRRRGRLRTSRPDAGAAPEAGRVYGHPDRFAGLEAGWFWVEPIEVGRKKSWAELNARPVWEALLANPAWSMNRLAQSVPAGHAADRDARPAHCAGSLGQRRGTAGAIRAARPARVVRRRGVTPTPPAVSRTADTGLGLRPAPRPSRADAFRPRPIRSLRDLFLPIRRPKSPPAAVGGSVNCGTEVTSRPRATAGPAPVRRPDASGRSNRSELRGRSRTSLSGA